MKPSIFEPRDGPPDLFDDHRRKPFGRLVEKQETRAGAQDAADRQHLLLAAGKLRSLAGQPLFEIGEELVNLLQRQPARLHLRRQKQIFLHVEAGENAAFFRAERDPHFGDAIGIGADRFLVLETDRALPFADNSHDRFERRRLAGAVASEQRDDLARAHVEIDAVEDVRFAIPGLQPVDMREVRRLPQA